MTVTKEKVQEVLLKAIEVNETNKKDVATLLDVNYNTLLSHLGEGVPTAYELLCMCQLFGLNEKHFFKNKSVSPVLYISSLTEEDKKQINEISWRIKSLIKSGEGSNIRSKKVLAEMIGMDYRKLINKLNNNTLTATEFLEILKVTKGEIVWFINSKGIHHQNLIENGVYKDDDEKINFTTMDIDSRENIGIRDMHNYVNGGVVVDSRKRNGLELYFPYGMVVDYFKAVESGVRAMQKQIEILENDCNTLIEKLKDNSLEMNIRMAYERIVDTYQTRITETKNHIAVLEMVSPVLHEI